MSLTGHAAVIGAWQLLERDDLGHRRHLQVTLCLLGRDDPGHRMTSLTGHSALIGAWRPLFSWNVIGWPERPNRYKLRQAAADSQLSDQYGLWA